MSDSLDSTNPDSAAAPADASGSESSLTDAHHDWVSSFTGIDTRATATSSGSGDSGGGVWGALSGAVSAAGSAVADAAGGVIDTVETAAGGVADAVGKAAGTVADAAGGVVDTVETAAGGVADAVVKAAGTVADAAGGVVDTVKTAAGDVADAVVKAAGTVADAAGDAVVEAESAQYNAAMQTLDAEIKNVADAGLDASHYVAQAKDIRGAYAEAMKVPGNLARIEAVTALMRRAEQAASDAKTDVARVKKAAVEDIGKAVLGMVDSARTMIAKLDDKDDEKGKLTKRLHDLDADIAAESKLTDRRARAEKLKEINVAAESLFDSAADAQKAKDPDAVQAVYAKALKDRYGIEIKTPPGFKNTHLDKIYKMFDKVPETDVVQSKMKKLSYDTANPSAWYSDTEIQFGSATGAENTPMEYTNPKTGAKEHPNWFNLTALHELGHSVDDRFGIMSANGGKPGCGGWRQETVDSAAQAMLGLLGGTKPALDPKRLHDLTVLALRNGLTTQPPDVTADDWKALAGFFARCGTRRSAMNPWASPLDVNGRSYHQAYSPADGGEQWVSFSMSSHAGTLSNYQWRAPGEWFAEIYSYTWLKSMNPPSWVDSAAAAYMYGGKAEGGAPSANH